MTTQPRSIKRIKKQPLTVNAIVAAVFYCASLNMASAQTGNTKLYPLNEVRLLESPFLKAQQTDLKYMMRLEPDRLLSPFLREAGLKPKAPSYGNWENSGLDGHTAGHYLTALAQMYASTGSVECKKRLDYMVSELARCQTNGKNGYVGGVPDSRRIWVQVKLGDFSSFDKAWVPWYNLHKLFAGLRDSYLLAGNQQAKVIFLKLTDWANDELSQLSDAQVQAMLNTEHGGMNEVVADAYSFTHDQKYLKLAQKFCHQAILIPLKNHQDKLTGLHANTQIPKVVGFERIAELSHDSSYSSAARFFWQTVVQDRSIAIGGNSVREHFNPPGNFTSMLESEQGPETCNTNNMLKLSKMLFMDEGRHQYIDFYERALYNHILSSQHPDTGGFVYFTPIHPMHYRVYSTASQSFWCCVGTGMENHGKYGELIYTHQNNDVYVNLFIPSALNWKEKGITLIQQNQLPDVESTALMVKTSSPKHFAIYIRNPYWVKNDGFAIELNGKVVGLIFQGDYARLDRVWHQGDKITINLPMKNYAEYLPDHSPWVSFLHGPIVLAASTDTTNMPGLFADSSRWGHIAGGPLYALNNAPLLIKTDADPSAGLKKVPGRASTFEISDLVYQTSFKHLKLVPFYRVHDTRYMVYWPITSKDSLKQTEAALAALDENYIKLAPRTLDEVFPGEQQPESDHHLDYKDSETGSVGNLHYRYATGVFSYRLRHSSVAKFVRISYLANANGFAFDVSVNKTKVAHITPSNTQATGVISVEYPLPAASAGTDEPFVVEFVATDGLKTADICDVRLLK